MQNWLLVDAAIFAAGICCGVLVALVWARLSPTKRRGRDLSTARRRILAHIKDTHDQEILHEAFRAAEALRTEMLKSVHRLRASMSILLAPVPPTRDQEQESTNQGAQTAETESRRP